MNRILIVEDDLELTNGLKLLLDNNGYEGIVLDSFEHPLEDILKLSPQLILLDIHIPNVNGEYLLKELRKNSEIPVIMVTSSSNELDEVISMSYGADDYITKPYNPTILLLRIEAVMKRIYKNQTILTYQDMTINSSMGEIEKKGKVLSLSKNEMRVLTFLLSNKGTIVSRDDIMNYLWDTDSFVDDNTLTVNINRLRHKLEELGMSDVVHTKRGQGYIIV